MGLGSYTYIAKSNDIDEVERELQLQVSKHKKRALKIEKISSEEDIYITTKISHIVNNDGDNHFKCTITYYNLPQYKKKTLEELKNEIIDRKDELKELEEEFEEIKDLSEKDYNFYGFDSKKEYEERLEDLNDEINLIQSDVEVIEKIIDKKENNNSN